MTDNIDIENPGGKIKAQREGDDRDIVINQVLGTPTDFSTLPKKTNFIDKLTKTNYQGCVPCCSSAGGCNAVMVQNIFDFKDDTVDVDFFDIRKKMGHKQDCEEDGDYIENFLKILYKNGVSGTVSGRGTQYRISGYGYQAMPRKEEDLKTMKYWILNKGPLIFATQGNKVLWNEMSAGELKTLIPNSEVTGGHILGGIIDYDDDTRTFEVLNTFKPNYKNAKGKMISKFKISYDYFLKAVNSGQFSWRYWIIYDNMDIPGTMLFPDFCPKEGTEEYSAVARAKSKGLIKGVKHNDGKLYLEPGTPITRLDLLLILYRLNSK